MPSTCDFELNSPNGVYFSGETVSGTVTLKTTSDKNVNSIRIRLFGEAKIQWEETEDYTESDGTTSLRAVHYRSNDVYINNTRLVRGEGLLPAGTHTYSLNFQLPDDCPTSCEGKFGNIRYVLWLLMERPLHFPSEYSRVLTVVKLVDLNHNPAFRIPLEIEEISSSGCWPCCSGNISYKLTIPLGAWAPGQSLRYALLVNNQSYSDMMGFKVEFIEQLIFNARSPKKKLKSRDSTLASQYHDAPCLRHRNRLVEGSIVLPSMPPSTNGYCVLSVQYRLELEIIVGGCRNNKTTISVPITIGNVPLGLRLPEVVRLELPADAQSVETLTPANTNRTETEPSAPLLPPPEYETSNPPSYGELLPPSFEEAVRSESPFIDTDANEYNRIIGFRPMYPMYTNVGESQN